MDLETEVADGGSWGPAQQPWASPVGEPCLWLASTSVGGKRIFGESSRHTCFY